MAALPLQRIPIEEPTPGRQQDLHVSRSWQESSHSGDQPAQFEGPGFAARRESPHKKPNRYAT